MSTTRKSFLSSLTTGTTVHFILSDDSRIDAVVSAVTRKGFVIITADFREIRLDADGYVPGSASRRIEAASMIAADQWNTVARDEAAEYRQALQARASLRYGIGANAGFSA